MEVQLLLQSRRAIHHGATPAIICAKFVKTTSDRSVLVALRILLLLCYVLEWAIPLYLSTLSEVISLMGNFYLQRRKEQNRNAQRNHRKRTLAKLEQVKAKVESQKREIEILKQSNQALLLQFAYWQRLGGDIFIEDKLMDASLRPISLDP